VTGAGRISGEATRLESMKRNQRAKFVQGNERKFAFISFHFLFRIETLQWVAQKK